VGNFSEVLAYIVVVFELINDDAWEKIMNLHLFLRASPQELELRNAI
jgi:hypothetical protein